MILGKSRSVSDPEEKASALLKLTEHIIPGRTQHARAANDRELSQTAVLAIDLNEVSAKASACAHITCKKCQPHATWSTQWITAADDC